MHDRHIHQVLLLGPFDNRPLRLNIAIMTAETLEECLKIQNRADESYYI
jgi:hypothetical protein